MENPERRPEPLVLIVDDDPDTTNLVSELIERHAMLPVRAGSVSEAVYALEVRPIRYVITDYSMPGEDGLALLSQLQSRPEWAHIPATMISGHDRDGDIARAASERGARFMAKPLDLGALLATVQSAVESATGAVDPGREATTMPAPPRARGAIVEIDSTRKRDPRSE